MPTKYNVNSDGDELYIQTDDVNKLYIINRKGHKRYAKLHDGREYYGSINGKQILITQPSGHVQYAKDTDRNEFYPTDEHGNHIYGVEKNRHVVLAKMHDGEELLPKDVSGNILTYPQDHSGNYRYPKTSAGNSKYTKDPSGNEVYHLKDKNNAVIFAKNIEGKEIYAVDGNGNEYYPPNQFILREDKPLYAVDKHKRIIYPIDDKGEEYYLPTAEGHVFFNLENVNRYIQLKNGEEIYPLLALPDGKVEEYILAKRYAKNDKGEYYYPVDGYGNEYLDFTVGGFLSDYPITTDNIIIVPEKQGEPHFHKSILEVNKSNIIGVLYRSHGYQDFLTNVKSFKRTSRRPITQYKYKKLTCAWPHLLYITIGFLFFIVMLFMLKNIVYD